jgi:hypothetical protein
MAYINLPTIGLVGEWTVNDAERTLAARLVPTLPPAPAPGADPKTRWEIVDTTLRTVLVTIRDNGKLLFGGRRDGIPEEPGKVDMIGMPFTLARLLNTIETDHRLAAMRDRGNECLDSWTERLEPEVEQLRRALTEAATS